MESDPFPGLKIDSPFFLDDIQGRTKCPRCGRSRKFYCYSCYVPLGGPEFESRVPRVKLPVKIDIIKHPQEVEGKSTAVHAGILCPDHVTIYTYPTIPHYPDKDKVLLVFPGKDAVSFEEYVASKNKQRCHGNQNSEDIKSHPMPSIKCDTQENSTDSNSVQNMQKLSSGGDISIESAKTEDFQVCKETFAEETVLKSGAIQGGCMVNTDQNAGHDNMQKSVIESNTEGEINNTGVRSCKTDVYDSEKSEKNSEKMEEIGMETEPEKTSPNPGFHGDCDKWARVQSDFDRVVFIDSTWHTVNKICTDPRLQGIQRIELKLQKTKFWRYQLNKPDTYLATIEAVYYFLREYHGYYSGVPYQGQYDNLLFYFVFMYHKIRGLYEGGKRLKAYSKKA